MSNMYEYLAEECSGSEDDSHIVSAFSGDARLVWLPDRVSHDWGQDCLLQTDVV